MNTQKKNSVKFKVVILSRFITRLDKLFFLLKENRRNKHNLLFHIKIYIKKRPRLKRKIEYLINGFPWLRNYLEKIDVIDALSTEELNSELTFYGGVDGGVKVMPLSPLLPESLRLFEGNRKVNPWVRFIGHIEGHYSLAIVNRGLATSFEGNGGKIQFIPFHGEKYQDVNNLSLGNKSEYLRKAIKRNIPESEISEAISIVHHYPLIKDDLDAGLKGVVFFWEETHVPRETIFFLNSNFDIVWVAASSVKYALINSGCTVPVFVIPIGIDHLITKEVTLIDKISVTSGINFRFFHLSSAFERKGVDVLIKSFLDEFTRNDAVELYIKTFPNPHNNVKAQLDELIKHYPEPAKVIIDEESCNEKEMLGLYRKSHVMVLPSRGEGFNLPAAEAMAMGLPVITTGYSAHADYCTLETATLLDFQFMESRSHLATRESCWVEPNYIDLRKKMRDVYSKIINNDSEFDEKRIFGMTYVRKTYNWENACQGIISTSTWLKKNPINRDNKIKISVFSPWGIRCGVAEYAFNLLGNLPEDNVETVVYCDERNTSPKGKEKVSWTINDQGSICNALDMIAADGGDVVLVQHHPGLIPLSPALCKTLGEMSIGGRTVLLELHSTSPLLNTNVLCELSVEYLKKVDRIIVHQSKDLNNLMARGLVNNVMLLPLGVIDAINKPLAFNDVVISNVSDNSIVLGCFGFALEHKGIDTLIKTIKPLESITGKDVYLLSLNSILDERSVACLTRCKDLADRQAVQDKIIWMNDYKPIEECQKILSSVDYIVLPYKTTVESASAAVTVSLSTMKPVLVSPLHIFNDLHDVTYKMNGCDENDIVQSVVELANKSGVVKELAERQRIWLEDRSWGVISNRLFNIMNTLLREKMLFISDDVVALYTTEEL